jgi:hypothetical protein
MTALPSRVERGLYLLAAATLAYVVLASVLIPRVDPGREVDAVVVLSAGVNEDGLLDRPGRPRLLAGLDYASQHGIRTIITTRVLRRKPPFINSDADQRHIVDSVHAAVYWVQAPNLINSTREEAQATLALQRGHRVAVVTSRFHTRRACATFEKVGFEVVCVSSGWNPWWKIPIYAVYESAGLIKYRFKGWI